MVRVRCEKCGYAYPQKAGHRCPPPQALNDNASERDTEQRRRWKRQYMAEYMRKLRQRQRQEPDQ